VYYLITVENEKVIKKWIDARKLLPIVINGSTYPAIAVLEALNYGISPLFSHLSSQSNCRKHIQGLSQIWDRSLLNDFAKVLFDNTKDVYKVVSGVNLGLCGPFEDYMAVENLALLLGVLTSFRGVLSQGDFRPPNSYIVRDLIASVEYLKESIANPSLLSHRNPKDCAVVLESSWRETLKSIHP